MKAKTIDKTIRAKVADWLLSIDDPQLAKEAERDIIVTGGCIASMFLQEPVNDYDVYFSDQRTVFKLAKHYIEKMVKAGSTKVLPMIKLSFDGLPSKTFRVYGTFADNDTFHYSELDTQYALNPSLSSDEWDSITRVEIFVKSQGFSAEGTKGAYQYFETQPQENAADFFEKKAEEAIKAVKDDAEKPDSYRPVFMSSNAITLSDKFQIVLRFAGTPDKVHESYDFVHATNYWTTKDGLVTNVEALEALLAKELIYRGSLYPLASIFRTRKFIKREWSCHIGNYLKMALQLNEFDLNNPEVLEEQLTGVDAAYLHQIIKAVHKKLETDKNFQFNATYLCELVDRLMG